MQYVITITKPDGKQEIKGYDKLGNVYNRMKECAVYGWDFKVEGGERL
ncbi:MAG: hypothetical protein KBT20_00865 [Bacteroidales bacterium]|nr:hypothetical protein [Candidatus Liminaster caballi]